MNRNVLILMLAAAPLLAQQSPVRPPLPPLPPEPPEPAMPMPAPEAAPAPVAAVRAAAAAARADAVAARVNARFDMQAAKADGMRASQAAIDEAKAYALDATLGQRFDMVQGAWMDLGMAKPLPFPGDMRAPRPWAPQDPADSLYRQAQQAMNRGDYRRAASLFKDIPVKQPNSVYVNDALYWEAFSLYRIGGTPELQEALTVLYSRKAPGRARPDADPALATRIAGVLAARGLGDKELVKRALSEGSGTCDTEDQAVRAEALNALRQTDPDEALAQAKKILGRKDDCSLQLRRSALWLLASKKDAAATATLVGVAKSDPSPELRAEATGFLGMMGSDEALAALEELVKSDDDRVQRAAVRALVSFPNPRARTAMRTLIENNGANEQLRMAALDAFNGDRATQDDATWLRGIYAKVESPRVKARIVSAVARIGGDQNDQWLMGIFRNDDESVEVRQNALRTVARTADIANLVKLYDGVSARPLREEVIGALGDRKEPEATDKLIDIARNGTDPQVRRSAIDQLARKKDPRTTKLLLDLISGDAPSRRP